MKLGDSGDSETRTQWRSPGRYRLSRPRQHASGSENRGAEQHEHQHDTTPPPLELVKDDEHNHAHSHGLVDRAILRSRAGIRAVSWSLGILTLAALAQAFIYTRTLSVALLADLIQTSATRSPRSRSD
jgi:hypothetical protein